MFKLETLALVATVAVGHVYARCSNRCVFSFRSLSEIHDLKRLEGILKKETAHICGLQ